MNGEKLLPLRGKRDRIMKQRICFALLSLLLMVSCSDNKPMVTEPEPIDTIPMMVMQIQKCAKLYTAEYHVHKIVTHDDCHSHGCHLESIHRLQ